MGKLPVEHLQKLLKKHPTHAPKTYIETGLQFGTQMAQSCRVFDTLYGIELNEHYFKLNQAAFEDQTDLFIFHDDSATALPALLGSLHVPLFILLDAHYCKQNPDHGPQIDLAPFPLYKELEAVKGYPHPVILVVDDVHVFGKEMPHYKLNQKDVEWEGITKPYLTDFFAARLLDSNDENDGFIMWLNALAK